MDNKYYHLLQGWRLIHTLWTAEWQPCLGTELLELLRKPGLLSRYDLYLSQRRLFPRRSYRNSPHDQYGTTRRANAGKYHGNRAAPPHRTAVEMLVQGPHSDSFRHRCCVFRRWCILSGVCVGQTTRIQSVDTKENRIKFRKILNHKWPSKLGLFHPIPHMHHVVLLLDETQSQTILLWQDANTTKTDFNPFRRLNRRLRLPHGDQFGLRPLWEDNLLDGDQAVAEQFFPLLDAGVGDHPDALPAQDGVQRAHSRIRRGRRAHTNDYDYEARRRVLYNYYHSYWRP